MSGLEVKRQNDIINESGISENLHCKSPVKHTSRIVFGAGGTGGHVMPALALADVFRHMGYEALFIGNANSIESKLCSESGYRFKTIRIKKLYRSLKAENLLFPFYLVSSFISSLRFIKQKKPLAVVCTGGFVSGPVAIAAVYCKVPLFFHESNSFPGLVTRYMAKHTKTVYIAFEGCRKYLSTANLKNLGMPMRSRFTWLAKVNKADNASARTSGSINGQHPGQECFSLREIGLDDSQPTILVSGGSQGSLAINLIIEKCLNDIAQQGYQLIWQTGKTTYQRFKKYAGTPGVHLFDFSPLLPQMLLKAQIAITRAGAMTIAELQETNTPAILIPLPTAAENHQYYNALDQQQKGFALMLEQKNLTHISLLKAIDELTTNLQDYQARIKALPENRAAENIVEDIITQLNCAKGKVGHGSSHAERS